MKELKSISLVSELLSGKGEKEVKVVTYDPLSETTLALLQGNEAESSISLIKIPDDSVRDAHNWSEEMKSKEYSTTQLKGLAQMKNEKQVIECEANPKGKPQYLPPYLLAESRSGKQIFTTDTYNEPDCLRFCPSNSSDKIEISLSGLTVRAKAQSQTARTNKAFTEGVFYWEIICPISCSTLQIGVSNKNQKEEVVQQFRTTTPRVIGVELNLEKLTLNFWLNGRYIKERSKKVNPNQSWYPTVKFKEPDYFVVINPFAQGRGFIQEEINTNYLPITLRTNEDLLFNLYISTQLKGLLLAYGLNQVYKNTQQEVHQDIRKLLRLEGEQYQDVKILYNDKQGDSNLTYTILQFPNEQESIRFFHSNKDLKILFPKQIATLLQYREGKEKMDLPVDMGPQVLQLITQKVFTDDKALEFLLFSGLSSNLRLEQLAQKIMNLKNAIEDGKIQPIQNRKHDEVQDSTQILYLEKPDKVLIVNGAEMKLVTRSQGNFDLESASNFTMVPQNPQDKIRLDLNLEDLTFIIKNLDWSQVNQQCYDILGNFLEICQNSNTLKHVLVPYNVALAAVKILLNIAISQYEYLESSFEDIDRQEVIHKIGVKIQKEKSLVLHDNDIDLQFQFGEISIVDAHQLLSVLLGLEDQLWSMIQSDQIPSQVKDLWHKFSSRIHTSYGRLSSLITYPVELQSQQSVDLATLAELGIVNTDDKYGKLEHFQEFKVELENVFLNQRLSKNDLQVALEKQFPQNLLLKGFQTWNVELAQTLNHMPPVVHQNGLTDRKNIKPEIIANIKQVSNFIMTGAQDGSINIWNTKLKLHCMGSHNFKSKLYQEEEIELSGNLLSSLMQEEEKKDIADVKLIIKKSKNVKASKAVQEAEAQDILYTMFDEQQEVEYLSEEDIPSQDEGEHISEFIYEYLEQPSSQQKQLKTQKSLPALEEEKKEESKEQSVQSEGEKAQSANPNEDFLNQLVLMGFNVELSKKALLKVKNESLSAALDAIMELQASEPQKKQEEVNFKIVAYNCSVCTYLNQENKAVCEVCGTAAPQTAYVFMKSEEQIKKEQEEEERKRREEEEEQMKLLEIQQKKEEDERIKKEKEEEEKRLKEELKAKTKNYYERAEVYDYLFAELNSGKDAKPLISAVVFKNREKETHDIEVVRFGYHHQYLRQFIGQAAQPKCQICDIPFGSQDKTLAHVFDLHKDILESLYPIFIGNQQMSHKWNTRINRHEFQTMKSEQIATLILPFVQIDFLCQVGTNITDKTPMYIIAGGKKTHSNNNEQQIVIQRIEYSHDINEIKITSISDNSTLFKDQGMNDHISKVIYCARTEKLIVLFGNNNVHVYNINRNDLSLQRFGQLELTQNDQIIKVESGIIFVKTHDQNLRRIQIDEQSIQKSQLKEQIKSHHSEKKMKDVLTENDVLAMQIDPEKVSIQDIQKYEKLMNGKPINGISNAQKLMSNSNNDGQSLNQIYYTKHHWNVNKESDQSPLEIEFEHPTSLISLNIELTFNCVDVNKLTEKLTINDEIQPLKQIEENNKSSQIETSSLQQESNNVLNLGLLSIHGGSDTTQSHQQHQQQSESQSKQNQYLPLVVNHHKGAAYNQSYQVCRVVTDNSQIFASNYPRPEFYFKHQHGHKMNIDKFTVRSNPNSKCGAYPIGSGLIFFSDNLQSFEKTLPFHKFTQQDYIDWKTERIKDPSPLKSYEPVAYFEFDENSQITLEVDFQRTCKYILLKPTGFRKKPTMFTQNMNNVPMEIEFFGVIGSSFEEMSDNDQGIQEYGNNQIQTQYELELRVLNDSKTLKQLGNIEIQQLQGFDIPLSNKVISKNAKDLSKATIVGKTQLKITDPHLQLQEIEGLSVSLKSQSDDIWILRGVSIQGIVAEQDQGPSQYALFNKPEIPISYMRSCLLSPKFYPVVNKILAQIAYTEHHSQQLRITIIQFLNKIMKLDRDFVPLIFRDLDLDKFLKVNLFYGDASGIQLIVEFLQNFQRDVDFCHNLYNILLKYVQLIPENFISYQGYEAFIGMLKWSIPINPEKTLAILIESLYQKVCLQKVSHLQTKEYINFRSRQTFNTFPFDMVVFKSPKSGSLKSSFFDNQVYQSDLQNRQILPVELIKRIKSDTHHIYEVSFQQEMLVTDLRLFFSSVEQIQFKLLIKIFGENNELVHFSCHDEQIFAQFAYMIYQRPSTNNPADDSFHLTHINYKGKYMRIVIEFGTSNSSMPRGNTKSKPPESLLEVYGQPTDVTLTQLKLKEMIDNKAKEFWQGNGKITQIGRSISMLQLAQDSEETHLVPQGCHYQPSIGSSSAQQNDLELTHQASQPGSQYKNSDLELLQEELKGKLRANDSNVKEIVEKIQQIQANLNINEEVQGGVIQSLEYYLQITSDFAKIIRSIIKNQKIPLDKINSIFRQAENDRNLSNICFDIFKRFVVYDQGQVKVDTLNFITECLYPLMNPEEYRAFTFRVIEEFLSAAHTTFSQKSVLEALTTLGIPEGELISFLIHKLNISGFKQGQVPLQQPFILMSSVLILALNSLKKIYIPEPGQIIHKGINCNGCKSKFIVGWRYKCGHCAKDVNFDSACADKHLIENPDHVMIIIQEPLPYNSNTGASKVQKQTKPLLPKFEFKEKPAEGEVTHDDFNCENCGMKPVIGPLYKCANCEDYNLCQNCYSKNLFDHFSYHVFMKLTRALKAQDKNPKTLLQVLDPRLYPSKYIPTQLDQLSPTKKKPDMNLNDQEEVDDFEDLAPLAMGRSLSMPMSQNKKPQTVTKVGGQKQEYEKLDYDQQFVVLFHTCVWVCQDPSKSFGKEEKIVLLKLIIDTMLQLIKLTSVKHLYEVISNKEAFFQLLVTILQLNSPDLINLFKSLFDMMKQPPSLQRKIQEDKQKSKQVAQSSDKKEQLVQEQKLMKQLLETQVSHVQSFLKWLVDLGLNPDLAKLQAQQGQESWSLLLQNYTNQRVWLEQLSIILELFIKATDELKEHNKNQNESGINGGLEKIIEEQQENEGDDDLVPLSMARSINIKAKSLQRNRVIDKVLILNVVVSIKIFNGYAKIFDSLVNAFLMSTEEIKQITYPQILTITEIIATQSVHTNDISKFICNLLFITLDNVTDNHHERVGYSICQGWLDILITSTIARNNTYEQNKSVYAKMNTEEISVFLRKTSQYMIQYLNKGSFEGVTGANMQNVMRLNLASDLIYVIRYAENKNKPGTLAIQELFSQVSSNSKLRRDYQDSIGNLLAWLFMNARQPKDDQITSQLGNSSTLTPATSKVKQITEHLEELLSLLADSENNEQAVKIALSSMTSIVKRMNKTVLDLAQNKQIGFDLSVRLSERANEFFIKLLSQWLISDNVASYFVFDLGGFEFLLDTIGVGSDNEKKVENGAMDFELIEHDEEQKQSTMTQVTITSPNPNNESTSAFQSLLGSDLAQYLESNIQDFAQKQQSPKQNESEAQQQVVQYDKSQQIYVQEFSKNIAMVDNNGGDLVTSYQKTDWSVNKRAYKHRIIVKHLVGNLRPEYWILFSLPHPVELREIQIAFNNYWGADTEVYSEPLSVLVEAGMEQNNLSLVCNLQIAKDDAFGSVSATVYGQNLQAFPQSSQQSSDLVFSLEDMISQKLQSLQNFKVQYVKFRMRRHVLTCLENSPLSTKFSKQTAFGINYISLLGFDMSKVGEYISYIKQEQKKTALEVLSIICSGDFSNILKVIANQQQTIEKMKKSFNLLASLVSIKQNLIEPTFIAISTYNTEMGDWIINQFLKSGRNFKHASLVGEIVMCNKNELPRRLSLLKDHVMVQLRQITQEERSTHGTQVKKLLPFIQIFIQTLRIAAPDLEGQMIDLGIKESYLTDIVQLLSAATQEREQQTKILIQLLILLLCPPAPFTNTNIDVFEFTLKHLMEDSNGSDEIQQQRENLASILSATKTQIAEEILRRGMKLDKLLNPGKGLNVNDDEKVQNTPLQHCIKFWINVSQDQSVKNQLAKEKIPLKLYEILRQDQPEQSNKIIRRDSLINEQELNLMIELIKHLTGGIPELEGELAQSLMKDLEYLSKIRDMNFVNKVFLQLLRIEKNIPVCLWPYDSENKKWLASYKPVVVSDSQNQNQFSHNNFVPSQILSGEKRSVFMKNFKEIVGSHSKTTVKKLLSSSWTLAHSQSEMGQVSQFQGFWKSIENKSPVVVLVHGTTSAGNNVVYGCYCTKGIPSVPSNLAQDSDYPVVSSPEDFTFCYIDDNSFHHFAPKAGVPIISMFTDYEGGGALSIANDYILLSFSYDFVFTVGVMYDLEKIQEGSNPKPEKEVDGQSISFLKFEVWTPNTKEASSQSAAAASQATQLQKSKSSGPIQTQLEMSLNLEVKHPWFNTLSPFVNYRTNPVFMIPAHLTLSQLSKILLESNVFFKTRYHSQLYQSSETLEDLYKELQENKNLVEQMNGIVDLEYEVNQLLNVQQSTAPEDNKEGEEAQQQQEGNGGTVLSGYVPKMGLFEQFETKGGVKQIISVTLQSMKLWKAEEQAKSWELWLKELESFSEIPLFFQLFLKNTRCKDLLFKVLAGLPDTEINAEGNKGDAKTKWDEEQKVAVQFNYKILSEAFQISNDLKLRDTAMKCGLLPRILDRLAQISGEKPRTYDEQQAKIEEEKQQALQQNQNQMQQEKNVEKKKRKGVGYSSKVGQTFNVTQYLENKKQRNDQIKNLIDICSNFINCKEWKAGEEVLYSILESALLPLLESAFRNGSWLDMAKEYEVYHSYLALTRALASQRNLISCLVEIDPKYKPSQTDPIYRLLQKLNDLAEIFINCLNQQQKTDQVLQFQSTIRNIPTSLPKLNLLTVIQQQNTQIPQLQEIKPPMQTLPNIMNLLQTSYKHPIYSPPLSVTSSDDDNPLFSQGQKKKLSPFYFESQYYSQKKAPSALNYQNIKNEENKEQQQYYGILEHPPLQDINQNEEFKELDNSDDIEYFKPLNVSQKNTQLLMELKDQNVNEVMTFKPIQAQLNQIQKSLTEIKNSYEIPMQPIKTLDQAQEEKLIMQKIAKQNIALKNLLNKMNDAPSISESSHSYNDEQESDDIKEQKQSPPKPTEQKKSSKSSSSSCNSSPASKSNSINGGSSSSSYETVSENSLDNKDENQKNNQEDKSDEYETISEESIDDIKAQNQKSNLDQKITKLNSANQKLKNKEYFKKNWKKKIVKKKYNKYSDSEYDDESSDYDSESDQSDDNESDVPSLVEDVVPSPQKLQKNVNIEEEDSHSIDESDYGDDDDDSPSDSHGEDDDDDDSQYDTESEVTINSQEKERQNQAIEMDSEIPENLARDVIKTYKIVQAAVQKLLKNQSKQLFKLIVFIEDENFIENALHLPIQQSYRTLLQDLRFDYMDMKDPNDQSGSHYKHHYQSIAAQAQNPPPSKMVRLAQELADLSNALPSEHTNAIFVRVDQQRVDMMKALICGASNTPYAHGCYEYDIFCDNNYPRDPPKMNLITTGSGSVRFNPNLYACGKVCLSLLGTWRGSATENWDPKLSTILQVLLSTQAIIMSEEVYFNEPGFENEAGTPEGEKKNEGYQNIVRYCNIKFAMIEQIKKPSRGFESVVKRHFYIKKAEILKEVNQWVEYAEKNEASYSGLVNDHNYNWANQFKQSKNKYKEMLQTIVQQLEEELNKLERPTDYELKLQSEQKKRREVKKKKRQAITEGKAELGEIDMETDEEEMTMINTESKKEINIEDEAVKDRWSRYIGAMGVEAVAKQSAANIFLSGAGALGIEIAKNLVLAGCKIFTLHDYKPISYRDLSGQFFLNLEEDILNEKKKKATRGEASFPRLKQLNYYVKCLLAQPVPIPLDEVALEKEPWNFHLQDVIIITEGTYEEIIFINEYCRKKQKKFIAADAYGAFTRVFNDFGDKFEVLDKNGEDLQDVMVKSITNEEEGVVELIPNMKHKFEDGDEVLITQVEGMKLKEGEKHEEEGIKSDSINDTIHKVKVINPYTFKIGDTRKFEKYERNGIAKQLKTKKIMNFKSFKESMVKGNEQLPLDANLSVADFEKMQNNQLSHIAFEALDIFRFKKGQMPGVWDKQDAELFVDLAKDIAKRYEVNPDDWKQDGYELRFFHLFAFTSQGVFNPLCAFYGGFVAQECVKAITQKFTPLHQVFYYDALEVLPDFDPTKHFLGEDKQESYFEEKYVKEIVKTRENNSRTDGLKIVVGQDIVEALAHTRLFMVGAGAIGCELLKNYAMLGVGTGKAQPKKKIAGGSIVLTDPDVIEVSNLNRQFLFREKHLRKPKSSTAAAAAIYMNRDLKDNIIARLDKVHEGTAHIFTDQFFEELTVVTNALDNVHARRYIDARCVTAKTPLLESGTLGPKGHVQVVLPYKTESYGSMNDPEDNTEIPHCTLKMFPEETLHCVEWSRDKFGKLFTQVPQNTIKILDEGESFNPTSQEDTKSLKDTVKLLEKRPISFADCIKYARLKFEKYFHHDILQLLHVYPLDYKTKDGNLFWSLPKRPPLPIQYNPDNLLHCQFVTSMACLRANIFKVKIPNKAPRTEEFRRECGQLAAYIKVPEFVPNDEKAKEIQASVNKEAKEEEKKEEGEKQEEELKVDLSNDIEIITKKFQGLVKDLNLQKGKIEQFIQAEQFEKDNDQNFHIDFIYSMANCRSTNYKLDQMDWITVKLKAGRIVPALATTTAAVAGLQTLELVKLLKQCKKVDHRNVFLNLAVPIMQASEPGDVIKTKLTENIEVTLWDRWEVKKGKDVKLQEFMKTIEDQYQGLEIRDVMRGNAPIYFHAIMNAPGKEQEREKVLQSKVQDLVNADSDEKYVDLTITCVRIGDSEEKILSGVPPVRVYFE